ncbi:MAG TPA: hypothetical protein VGL99_03175 [Chloroflexota bacterium]
MTIDTAARLDTRPSGLTSDFGWGDADDASKLSGIGSAMLLIASSGAYCASVWLAHGLPPFHHLALRARRIRGTKAIAHK